MGQRSMANSNTAYLAKMILTSLVKHLYRVLSRLPAQINSSYTHVNPGQPCSRLQPSSPLGPCLPPQAASACGCDS